MQSHFAHAARRISRWLGHPLAFMTACCLVLGWGLLGLRIGFGDTAFNFLINDVTTIITFLMVFVIQNAQATNDEAIHVKLNEIIQAIEGARNVVMVAEELPVEETQRIHDEQIRVAEAEQGEAG
jgi:low affinity Fe/Cu permease